MIRQPVKPVPPHPLSLVAPRDRQQLCHAGQVMVERGIKTRNLRQFRIAPLKRLDQQDFFRHMLGIKMSELLQLLNHLRADSQRRAVRGPP